MSLRTTIRHGFFVLALSGSAAAPAATQCSLAGPSGARVSVAGSLRELPELLSDCNGVRVVAGEVTACVQDRRNRLSCRTFGAGETLSERTLGAVGSERGLLTALMNLLRGGSTNASAVTRGSPTGLPTGPVVFALGHVDVDFSLAALAGVGSVEFREVDSEQLVAKVVAAGSHRIESKVFRPGRTYRWSLDSAVPMLAPTGKFAVQDATLSERADHEARRVKAARAGAAADLMLAHWLSERGLEYDARLVLRRTGFDSR